MTKTQQLYVLSYQETLSCISTLCQKRRATNLWSSKNVLSRKGGGGVDSDKRQYTHHSLFFCFVFLCSFLFFFFFFF